MKRGIEERNISSNVTGPWRITFDTNPDDCNMSCIMCEEHSEFSPLRKERIISGRPHRRMDINTIRKVVAEMSHFGLKEIIPSTMGEPLLYMNFVEILDICKQYSIKLNLTTNGTWPKYGPEKWGNLICPVTKDVKISWNGASKMVQEGVMKGSSFERRLMDLKKFISVRDEIASGSGNRCNVTLQATFMESNLDELPDLVNLAIELGLDRLKGHQLWAHFPEIKKQDLRRSADSISRWNLIVEKCERIVETKRKSDGSKLILENFKRLDLKTPGTMPSDWICPFLGNEAWVNYEGRFDPCCAPDAERKSLGFFGKVDSEGGMRRIWNGAEYSRLRNSYMESPVCNRCNMRRPAEEVKVHDTT